MRLAVLQVSVLIHCWILGRNRFELNQMFIEHFLLISIKELLFLVQQILVSHQTCRLLPSSKTGVANISNKAFFTNPYLTHSFFQQTQSGMHIRIQCSTNLCMNLHSDKG